MQFLIRRWAGMSKSCNLQSKCRDTSENINHEGVGSIKIENASELFSESSKIKISNHRKLPKPVSWLSPTAQHPLSIFYIESYILMILKMQLLSKYLRCCLRSPSQYFAIQLNVMKMTAHNFELDFFYNKNLLWAYRRFS